jgi:hypothetical protein
MPIMPKITKAIRDHLDAEDKRLGITAQADVDTYNDRYGTDYKVAPPKEHDILITAKKKKAKSPFVTYDKPTKPKSPTKKEIKKLMEEVEAEIITPKIKTGKVKKLLKKVESKAIEVEGNKLIKKLETKIKKKKDVADIKQMIQQAEEVKPQYISTEEVDKTIKDMEYFIASKKLTKSEISYAKKKAKMIADKMKEDPSIIPVLRTKLLLYSYPIINAFYTDYPDLFKELYPKTDEMQSKYKDFMGKIEKEEKKETTKKAKQSKAVEAKAEKLALKEKFSKTKGLTPEEIKKFNQAKAYITRITSKTNGKHKELTLDKDDVAGVAHELLEMGFERMTEKLFLEAYKKYTE